MAHMRRFVFCFPQVRQCTPGPVQAALDCGNGQVERLGDLHFGAILPVTQHHGSPVGWVQALQADLQEAEQLAVSLPEVPTEPRLVASDATPEKVASLLAGNGGRLAVLNAESGGLFSILAGRYAKNGPNFDVFLQAHAGDPLRVDRVGRPSESVQHPALTLVLTPQPDVLAKLADEPGFRERGLLGRFLYALPASLVGTRKFSEKEISRSSKLAYSRLVDGLLSIPDPSAEPSGAFYRLKLSPGAKAIWIENYNQTEAEQAEAGLQHADVGFAARHDRLPPLQAGQMGLDWLLLAQVEEILFESAGALAQVLRDLFRQRSLAVDRPLERHDQRDLEIIEQAEKIARISLDPGAEALVQLRQKKALQIDDHPATTLRGNALHRCHVARA